MDIQTALLTAVECLIRGFSDTNQDWIKYLDSAIAIGNPERHVRKASHRGSKQ